LLDSAVPLLAVGHENAQQKTCRIILRAVSNDRLEASASVEMFQEFHFHRLRRTGNRLRSVTETQRLMSVVTGLAFDNTVMDAALDLISRLPSIRGHDAVHAATALLFDIPAIVSPDRAFDEVPGLRRVEPAELVAALT
jgi:predicted nucleic acid-binding protein